VDDVTRACPECGEDFTTATPSKRYCSEPCRARAGIRRWREKNPKLPLGERRQGRAECWRTCQGCDSRFDASLSRGTTAANMCSVRCEQWNKLHPGSPRVETGRTCRPCGVSIDHRPMWSKLCGARRCDWWNREHPGVPLPRNRTCVACGVSMDDARLSARYCSDQCRPWRRASAGNPVRREERVCLTCGSQFLARDVRAKYCSRDCKLKSARSVAGQPSPEAPASTFRRISSRRVWRCMPVAATSAAAMTA
jgi:hypothetical protein